MLYSLSYRYVAGDGVFSTINLGVVQLVDLKTNTTKDLVKLSDVKDVRIMSVIRIIVAC